MKRKATAIWKGTGKDGTGSLSSPSNFFSNTPYSAKSRFENEDGKAGTNPEELIAAAHAGCFNMALSFELSGKGYTPEELITVATVTIEKQEEGFAITNIHLELNGKVPDIQKDEFEELAQVAKDNCPVSKALSTVPISLNVTFS